MQLIKDEVVVKEFEYAKVDRGGKSLSCSVTITNKRVFTTDASHRQIAHTEYPLSKVKRIDAMYKAPNNWFSIMCIIYAVFAVILAIGVSFIKDLQDSLPQIYGLVAIVIVSVLIPAWIFWQYPTFKWTLSTVGVDGKVLYTAVAKPTPSKGRIGRIKIHLSKESCYEFIYSMGAALAEARMLAEQEGPKAE